MWGTDLTSVVTDEGVAAIFVAVDHCPTDGCAERFIRTLKGSVLWVRRFATVEELRQALLEV